MKKLIKQLTEAYGPSGHENAVRDLIREQISDFADRVEVDPLGNLHAIKNGPEQGLKIMLAAHMDEIGLMVSYIDKNGFARFTPLGGVRLPALIGNRAIFTNGALAVISVEKWPAHDDIDSYRQFFLDFGVSSKEEVPVRVGDVAGFQRPCVELDPMIVAKSIDDRIGCAILIETLRRLEQTPHRLHFVFTVQEEVGLRGATTAAYKVHPDVSIAIDVAHGDVPERKHHEIKLGQGPAIKVMDGGMLAHTGLRQWMVETATEQEIPYQMEVSPSIATDAMAMQLAHEGSMAGALSIPCRYMHTPSEMVHFADVENTVKLLLAMLAQPARGIQ